MTTTNPRDDILGAIRKKGAFVFNYHSPKQRRDYAKPIRELLAEKVISEVREAPNRWLYAQGEVWNRRA
jgi:hypothetical protein